MYFSTVTTVSNQIIITVMLPILRSVVFCIPITYSACCVTVVKAVIKVKFFIFYSERTTCSGQLPDMVFLLPILWYQLFRCYISEPGNGILPQSVVQNKNGFVAETDISVFKAIKTSYTQNLIQSHKCIFWHTPPTRQSLDTFKSPLFNDLFK